MKAYALQNGVQFNNCKLTVTEFCQNQVPSIQDREKRHSDIFKKYCSIYTKNTA